MGRFFAGLLILFVVCAGLFFIFLASPLPKAVVESNFKRALPKTEYFKIGELSLLPWKPFEIKDLEYQLDRDPDKGILKAGTVQFRTTPQELFQKKECTLVIDGLSFASQQFDLQGFRLRAPIHFRANPETESRSGYVSIGRIETNSVRFKDVEILFEEKNGVYEGKIEIQWTGGKVKGRFRMKSLTQNEFSIEADLIDINLTILSEEVGGIFERASGQCRGTLSFSGDEFKILKGGGRIDCPRPGGRIKSKFLRGLVPWLPEGPARKVLEEEVAGKDDYYYDDASVEINNDKPGYWTLHVKIRNPRLNLDIPIDISANSFEAIWRNTELQKLIKEWSSD